MLMPQSRTAMALINEMAARHPEREALIDGAERYSWAEFRSRVRDLAKGLHAAGIRRGDKVAILMGNRSEWLIADFAIMALGGVMVAANTWATARELAPAFTLSTFDDEPVSLSELRGKVVLLNFLGYN